MVSCSTVAKWEKFHLHVWNRRGLLPIVLYSIQWSNRFSNCTQWHRWNILNPMPWNSCSEAEFSTSMYVKTSRFSCVANCLEYFRTSNLARPLRLAAGIVSRHLWRWSCSLNEIFYCTHLNYATIFLPEGEMIIDKHPSENTFRWFLKHTESTIELNQWSNIIAWSRIVSIGPWFIYNSRMMLA